MYKRMKREDIWPLTERMMAQGAESSLLREDVRLELVSAEEAARGGDMACPP
jgi:hypothetical protein